MRETELRDSLLTTVESEPPMALDIDDVITRARKETSRGRALLVTGAATLVLVGGIVVGPIVTKSMGGAQTAGFPGPAPSSQSTDLPVWTEEQLLPIASELGGRSAARIRELIPEATDFHGIPTRPVGSPGSVALAHTIKFKIGAQMYAISVKAMAIGVHERVASGACQVAETWCQQGPDAQSEVFAEFSRQVAWVDDVRSDYSVVTAAWLEPPSVSGSLSGEVIHGYLTALAEDPTLGF